MSDQNKKILLLNHKPEVTEQAKQLFRQFQIITADTLTDIAEKGKDDFDLVITGYAVPSITGDSSFAYLDEIKAAISNIETNLKQDKTAELIEAESLEQHEKILELLNNEIRAHSKEKADNEAKLEAMQEEVNAALLIEQKAEKSIKDAQEHIEIADRARKAAELRAEEAEKSAEEAYQKQQEAEQAANEAIELKLQAEDTAQEALKEKEAAEKTAEAALLEKAQADDKIAKAVAEKTAIIEKLQNQIDTLEGKISATEEKLELTEIEKGKIQEKLEKLQEAWENYVA
ncbi:Putative Methyl-accepting chemotaxis protein [Desulfamplus magnetovallimortis]|uniref:Putative Methyl-accepting chemotaxis protein n=1 Tax=Desulfamplus magnetovallimortis TaxID=1246637 RepID=L0R5A5_9BACT|nr:hypothetical protein [Desulfamplus magnetovallimortis]CCO06720.1 Putative Methyl-accepting chemotaxis protein [Desulfamplus magnetovallimortis BW-1]SLM32771.1 Putative Methyl-accepting chemotaxis protein [Desulfamplus magnetovallimortis]